MLELRIPAQNDDMMDTVDMVDMVDTVDMVDKVMTLEMTMGA